MKGGSVEGGGFSEGTLKEMMAFILKAVLIMSDFYMILAVWQASF